MLVTTLDEQQRAFATAVLDPARAVPDGLVGPDGNPSVKRFNVYRNNVVAGLTATLKDAFPAVARIVGDEFFLAMGRIYVATEPPASPIMLDYGRGFPDFVHHFAPVSGLPYLADVARIERAWSEAYHAFDVAPLEGYHFAQISAADLPNVCVTLHPSWRTVRSAYPSLAIWQMNVGDAVPAQIDLDAGGEDVFILRSGPDVEVRSLPPGAAGFIEALSKGHSIIDATKHAMQGDCRFNLTVCLSGLMAARAFTAVEISTAVKARPARQAS